MEISRRDFLRLGVGVLGSSLFPGKSIAEIYIRQKIGKEDGSALEKILDEKKTVIKDPVFSPALTDYPELLYIIGDIEGESYCLSSGRSYILDDNGFFISAFHILKEGMRISNQLKMIIYDPVTGIVSDAGLLAVSNSSDLLLGKMNGFKKCHPRAAISDSLPEELGRQYCLTYDSHEKINSIIPRIYHAFEKKNRYFLDEKELGQRSFETAAFLEIEGVDMKSDLKSDYAVIGEFSKGDSGTPIFNPDGSISGIIKSIPRKESISITAKDQSIIPIGLAVSGPAIRNIIESYLDKI